MKKFSLFLIGLLTANAVMAQNAQPCSTCLPGGISFTSQYQIDNFQTNYPGCTEIEGTLSISGDDITNLEGLNVLTSIGSTVLITSNAALTELTGLDGLTFIGGNLAIYGNPVLTSLTGLESLSTIGGSLSIMTNILLINLTGMDGLSTIGGDLLIFNGYSLTNLAGLDNLTTIGGQLGIYQNDDLTSLTGLNDLTSVGDSLRIYSNVSLASLSGLGSLANIGDKLFIKDNDTLTSLSALEGLTSLGGELVIRNNDALTSLAGLDNIGEGSITNLYIIYNSSLSTCEVQSICNYLADPNGTVEIHDNAQGCTSPAEVEVKCDPQLCLPDGITFYSQADIDNFQSNYPECTGIAGNVEISGYDITNLTGLSALTTIRGNFSIFGFGSLTSLTGLEGLATIGGNLGFSWCDSLTNLSGLDGLTSIGGNLSIYECMSLTNLSGLEGLTSIIGTLSLEGNPSLTSLIGLENLTTIEGDLSIFGDYSLASLVGLDNLASIGGNLYIKANSALTSLTGLDGLNSIGGELQIGDLNGSWNGNLSLTSLTGLEGLTSIGGDLGIYYNPDLTSLSGLDNIDAGSISNLLIEHNISLATCDVQSICEFLATPGAMSYIYANASGCNNKVEVLASCEVGVDESAVGGQRSAVMIYPNPANDRIYIEIPGGDSRFQIPDSNQQPSNFNFLISILDLNGREILQQESYGQVTAMDVSELSQGIYFVKVVSDDVVQVGRFVKQ